MISTSDSSLFVSQVPVTMDTKGRVRPSVEQRRLILAEFERSSVVGVSAVHFAERAGLKYSTSAARVLRERRSKTLHPALSVRLLEEMIAPAQGKTSCCLVLQLSNGARVEIRNDRQAALAAVLVRFLARKC